MVLFHLFYGWAVFCYTHTHTQLSCIPLHIHTHTHTRGWAVFHYTHAHTHTAELYSIIHTHTHTHGWAVFHYTYTHTHTHTHTRMYHIFFTYSSADGHLGCLQILPIVNSAAINLRVQASLWIILLSEYICPVVGLVDHMIILSLVFWGTSLLFSIVTAPT